MSKIDELFSEMILYYQGDPQRIQHFVKVFCFAQLIGRCERLDDHTQLTLESAALVHDIGIKSAEEKYGYNNGKLQEIEGPAPAKELLEKLDFSKDITERVCYLVGHHHTYANVDGIDYQILLEADFLVNMYEDNLSHEAINIALEKVFKTSKGIEICKTMYHNK